MKRFGLIAMIALIGGSMHAGDKSAHLFTVNDITGQSNHLSQFNGQLMLIVNTASKCGFTRQYADLVKLQEQYKEQGLVVMAFPANNFGNQEPGSADQIQAFCSNHFKINFPLMEKVSVKGDDQHPLFQYLTTADNPDFTGPVKWNFEKFLVGPDGHLKRRFRSMLNPDSKKMHEAIEEILKQSPSL